MQNSQHSRFTACARPPPKFLTGRLVHGLRDDMVSDLWKGAEQRQYAEQQTRR